MRSLACSEAPSTAVTWIAEYLGQNPNTNPKIVLGWGSEGGRHGRRRGLTPPSAHEQPAQTTGPGPGPADHGAHPSPPAPPSAPRRGGHRPVHGRVDPQLFRRRIRARRRPDVLGGGLAARHGRLGDARAPAAERAV